MTKSRSPQTPYWKNVFPGEACHEGHVRVPCTGSEEQLACLVDVDVSGATWIRQCNWMEHKGYGYTESETEIIFKDGAHLRVFMPVDQMLACVLPILKKQKREGKVVKTNTLTNKTPIKGYILDSIENESTAEWWERTHK